MVMALTPPAVAAMLIASVPVVTTSNGPVSVVAPTMAIVSTTSALPMVMALIAEFALAAIPIASVLPGSRANAPVKVLDPVVLTSPENSAYIKSSTPILIVASAVSTNPLSAFAVPC